MDTPDRFTWAELTTIAADRDGWRSRVRALKQPPRVEITINADVPGARVRNNETHPTPAPIKPKLRTTTQTNKYTARDAHEMFFRKKDRQQQPQHRYTTRSKKSGNPKGLAKPAAMTDKERAAWARSHFQQHYGTTTPQQPDSPRACTPVTDSPLVWHPPAIMGHSRHQPTHLCNQTLLPPCDLEEMFEYMENPAANNENLKNLSNLDH